MRTVALAALLALLPLMAVAQQDRNGSAHNHITEPVDSAESIPKETGQDAFAAIQEIISLLEADPDTNWTQVDIAPLRDHLVDMNRVVLWSMATAEPVEGGARFVVTGEGGLVKAVRTMTTAHAHTMAGSSDWNYEVAEHPEGAIVTVTGQGDAAATKIRALGFYGIMARGMHHQPHHLAIARGESPHE